MKQSIMILTLFSLSAGAYIAVTPGAHGHEDADFKSVASENLEWRDYQPAGFGPGLQIAVVYGDPSVPDEPYTIRASFPDGYIIPAHYHPRAENLTVLSGILMMGMGERFEESSLVRYRAGDYLYIPPEHPHFGRARGPLVFQLHGIGPFQTILIDAEQAGE